MRLNKNFPWWEY